jgi:integrase
MQARLSASKTIGGGSKGQRWGALVRPERIPQAAFFRTLALTGCRYGELVRATWDDLGTKGRTLTLRAAKTRSPAARASCRCERRSSSS